MDSKKHISELAAILKNKGLSGVVISPGSRNAPLTQAFYSMMPDKCYSIVDERSAGYFALGVTIKQQTPAVIVTTSGTAVLNLAPAIAEAYYQNIPLIVVTADRPKEWLGQHDNQTIHQSAVFRGNCKASFELPVQIDSDDDLWYANHIINQAYNKAVSGVQGPVHLNIPLREPLYDDLEPARNFRTIDIIENRGFQFAENLTEKWNNARTVAIICGQFNKNEKLEEILNKISEDLMVPVLAESIANIDGENIIPNADLILTQKEIPPTPELVIYFGGQVVSKRLKKYLRSSENTEVWYISDEGHHIDTFQRLSSVICCKPIDFFHALLDKGLKPRQPDYKSDWLKAGGKIQSLVSGVLSDIPYSDLWIHANIAQKLLGDDILFAGNSSVIRYLQFFDLKAGSVFANRGTSGIDGCVSTACGIASQTNQKVIAVVGDLSFVYDSNGLWNRALPDNLKIIVISNGGGSIFGMIPGPSDQPSYQSFFETNHPVSIEKITEAFQLDYFTIRDKESFEEKFIQFYASPKAALLEIYSRNEVNLSVFHNFIKKLSTHE